MIKEAPSNTIVLQKDDMCVEPVPAQTVYDWKYYVPKPPWILQWVPYEKISFRLSRVDQIFRDTDNKDVEADHVPFGWWLPMPRSWRARTFEAGTVLNGASVWLGSLAKLVNIARINGRYVGCHILVMWFSGPMKNAEWICRNDDFIRFFGIGKLKSGLTLWSHAWNGRIVVVPK